ncbi:MAG: DoxX family protein [Erythrobacter sp.]
MAEKGPWWQLPGLVRAEDATLLVLRALTGAFLVHGTWDNITSTERMAEFVAFLTQFGFVAPELMAPLSVWAQFVCGLLLIAGLLTRWAGLVVCFNFIVAVVMVHWAEDFRGWWPAIVLVALGLHFASRGGGKFALDAMLAAGSMGKR